MTLERNLALFSDPATPFFYETKGDKALARLIRYGEEREYFIDLTTGRIHGRHNKRRHSSLKALLASEDFADLRSFSATQRRVLVSKELDQLIPPAGVVDPDGASIRMSLSLGRELVAPVDAEILRILLIDGPAGVGKTSFIERMVYERAVDPVLPPIFHITSKGRRLSNLPDAVGKTASDLQADFRADQVPTLARLNAIQVAIDGFDELVQADGYGNAWAALQDFIRLMGRGGPLILAGRDTFFDQQDVRERLDRFGTRVNLTMVRLQEVSVQTAKEWLTKWRWNPEELASPKLNNFFRRPYTRRPFFLSQIVRHGSFASIPTERGSPQAILIEELVNREAKLLASAITSASEDRIKSALGTLFEEMATDMADREAETIPREFLEFYCDVAFDGIASEEELSAVRHRVGSVAFIETDETRGDLRFPHSEIQNHFFARAIFRALSARKRFAPLRTAVFGTDLVEAFADINRTASAQESGAVVTELSRMLGDEPFAMRLMSNVTALLIGSLVRGDSDSPPLVLKNVTTNEARVFDELGPAVFNEVSIGRLDARGADLSNIEFTKCHIGALIVDDTTRFGIYIPEVGTLQVDRVQSLSSEHSKERISAWLNDHSSAFKDGSDWNRGQDFPLVRLFDRVCRRFIRQHYIRDTVSDDGSVLLRDPNWPEILAILQRENRIVIETSKGGARPAGWRADFYHVVDPESLLVPEGDDVAMRIRLAVIQRAEELASA